VVKYAEAVSESFSSVYSLMEFRQLKINTFIIFYLLAIYYRKKTVFHIRFMILTVIPFIDPAAGRLHIPWPFLQLPLIVILLLVERFANHIYRPYLVGLSVWLTILITMAYLAFFNQPALDAIWKIFFRP
jgi:hypothetical protein